VADTGKGRLLVWPRESVVMSQSPTAEEHLAFLVKLQRLLSEGDFTATYKFALLMALADIAVERGHDDVRPLEIPMRDIAEKFVDYYWQQTMPYKSAGLGHDNKNSSSNVLRQSTSSDAKVTMEIQKFINTLGSLGRAKRSSEFKHLVNAVSSTVASQPIKFFQNIGGGTDAFVYERNRGGIVLKLGVSSHLRKFHSLIQYMARDGWIRHIKKIKSNIALLGQKDDLQGFLFESSREALKVVSNHLSKLTNKKCFYCHGGISDTPDVDHFIPFSLYGRDIAQNFVLAHASCNRSKSDVLGAKPHLENWLEHLNRHQDDISQIALDAGIISDQGTILSVTKWSYQQGHETGSHAWIKKGVFEPIGEGYAALVVNVSES
jgi:5-methylcytosine-specific restriction endonuclease McrA